MNVTGGNRYCSVKEIIRVTDIAQWPWRGKTGILREWILRVNSISQWPWWGKTGIGRETKAYVSRVLPDGRDSFAGFYVWKRKRKKKWNCLCKLVSTLGFLLSRVCIRSRPSLARLEPRLRDVDWALATLSLCRQYRACDLVFVPLSWLFAIYYLQLLDHKIVWLTFLQFARIWHAWGSQLMQLGL